MKNPVLENKELKLEFLFGYCILSYKNIFLTKNIGLYSSIYHNKSWYDSRFATWGIMNSTPKNLKLYGEWSNLPHRQTWTFEISEEGLFWEIECENLEESLIEMIQQNYMLTDSYTNWEVKGYARGRFPEFFPNYKGLLWDRVYSLPQMEGIEIVLSSDKVKVPQIKWISTATLEDTLIVIENTEPEYSARVIQLLFLNTLPPQIKEKRPVQLKSILRLNG